MLNLGVVAVGGGWMQRSSQTRGIPATFLGIRLSMAPTIDILTRVQESGATESCVLGGCAEVAKLRIILLGFTRRHAEKATLNSATLWIEFYPGSPDWHAGACLAFSDGHLAR